MYQKDALESFALSDLLGCLFELHAWDAVTTDKKTGQKNSGAGKTPLKLGWRNNDEISQDQIMSHIRGGGNLGFRIPTNMIVIDMDPRNYASGAGPEQVQENVAELLGFDTWEDLEWDCNLARTGGGGYHIYCQLPDNTIYKRIRSTIKGIKGVDIKKHGGYVVAPGSRHPNGEYYKWLSPLEGSDPDFGNIPMLGDKQLKIMLKPERVGSDDANDMYGKLTADDLVSGFLSLVPATAFKGNDAWLPIMMACNHVTGGDGDAMDAFIEWSCSDPEYSDKADKIRGRWESVKGVDRDGDVCSIGTLIHALKRNKVEPTVLRGLAGKFDFDVLEDDESCTEVKVQDAAIEFIRSGEFIQNAIENVDDLSSFKDTQEHGGDTAFVMGEILALPDDRDSVTDEMLDRIGRILNSLSGTGFYRCRDALVNRYDELTKGFVDAVIKSNKPKLKTTDVNVIIRDAMWREIYDNGKRIFAVETQLYRYNGKHWATMSSEKFKYLAELASKSISEKTDTVIDTEHCARKVLNLALSKGNSDENCQKYMVDSAKRGIINCQDCELHIDDETGVATRKPHSPQSYQLSCLDVKFGDEPMEDYVDMCPKFLKRMDQWFGHLPEGDKTIAMVQELFGYMIQPNKNLSHVFLFKGNGGNGKSTLLKIISNIIGNDAYYAAEASLFESVTGTGHETAELPGKLLIGIEDMETSKRLSDGALKRLSSGGLFSCNPKFKSKQQFTLTAGLIMCCNDFPPCDTSQSAIQRRLVAIPFERKYVDDVEANRLVDVVAEVCNDPKERAGILRWAILGLMRLRERGAFKRCPSSQRCTDTWLKNSSHARAFVEDKLDILSNSEREKTVNGKEVPTMTLSDLFTHYENYCNRLGLNMDLTKLSERKLKSDIEKMAVDMDIRWYRRDGERRMCVFGAKLKNEDCENDDDKSFAGSDFDEF